MGTKVNVIWICDVCGCSAKIVETNMVRFSNATGLPRPDGWMDDSEVYRKLTEAKVDQSLCNLMFAELFAGWPMLCSKGCFSRLLSTLNGAREAAQKAYKAYYIENIKTPLSQLAEGTKDFIAADTLALEESVDSI